MQFTFVTVSMTWIRREMAIRKKKAISKHIILPPTTIQKISKEIKNNNINISPLDDRSRKHKKRQFLTLMVVYSLILHMLFSESSP